MDERRQMTRAGASITLERMKKSRLVPSLTAAAGLGILLGALSSHGCASNCAANCPNTTAFIGNTDNYELGSILTSINLYGPACPTYGFTCVGDESTTACTHLSIVGQAVGECDVELTFTDRPSEVVHLQFGATQNSNGSCCSGYPVVGPSFFTIPDKPTGPIYVGDADVPNDAVTVEVDAGHDAGHDAGAEKTDAGTDAPPGN